MTRTRALGILTIVTFAVAVAAPVRAQTSFITFETGQVRPLALTLDGKRLLALNTPDNRLEIFNVGSSGLFHRVSIPVGLEPSALAVRGNEVWVVNHLSDSVSIVDLGLERVVRTLLVGDEPRDIVITDPDGLGPLGDRAFITTAHRGQQRTDPSIAAVPGAGDPQLTTPSVGRADVWVFDATNPGSGVGGTPLEIVVLFGDTPRALAVSPDGGTVYAAVFHSGNQTAVVNEGPVCNGFGTTSCSGDGITSPGGLPGGQLPGGNPGPSVNFAGDGAPEVGLIVQFDNPSGQWRDEQGRNWSNGIRFHLPDFDVFAIDAATLNQSASFANVGTILFNMVVNPVSGKVYVSNTEAQNLTRFEGPGSFGGSTVQGNLHQARITVLDGSSVLPRHLNKHINYAVTPAPLGTKDHSLATPLDMTIASDGETIYVAAFGSSKVGVFSTASLENDSFDPTVQSASYLSVSGGGPSGLALDEPRNRLYVLTRFDNSVSVIDLSTGSELNHLPLHNPEPPTVVEGRPFFYDAFVTSSNGEASCSSCHVFGDMDSLAWDLGNPDGDVTFNPQPINLEDLAFTAPSPINGTGNARDFHPMKGPMTTQTLRGMVNHGHMHWRGDRTNGFFGIDEPHTNNSRLSFKNFIVAFEGLVGSDTPPTDPQLQADMDKFADFTLALTLPPNPVSRLDNSLTPEQQGGEDFFLGLDGPDSGGGHRADGLPFIEGAGFTCEGCHTLDPAKGFFGTGGNASFEAESQIVKIPHLRNMYQKVGMFGMPNVGFNLPDDNSHKGDQVRGTGFLHDGSTDTLFRFLLADVFAHQDFLITTVGFEEEATGDVQRSNVEQFMLAFDGDLAPIVGQQVTLSPTNSADLLPRITLMRQQAGAPFASEILGGSTTGCDLVVKGLVNGEPRGWLYDPVAALFVPDRSSEPALSDADLRSLATTPGQELTYTCVPPGSGLRVGIDRDLDGALDADERDAFTDPGNPGSVPGACSDGVDNDGDGAIDLADIGCSTGSSGNSENPQCSDGIDNDNDGLVDANDALCGLAPGLSLEGGPVQIDIDTNGSAYSTGDTIEATWSRENLLSDGVNVDVHLVIAAPNGTTSSSGNFAMAPDEKVPVQPLFSHTWSGSEQAGTYVMVGIIVPAGADPANPTNYLGLDFLFFSFLP